MGLGETADIIRLILMRELIELEDEGPSFVVG